jgi:hypothetical protein
MTSTEITDHGEVVFRMEGDRTIGAGIDTGKTGLALLVVNPNSTVDCLPFKGIVLAGLDAFTLLALTAHHDFRFPVLGSGENMDPRLLQTVDSLLDGGAGQLAELASGASFFGYLKFHAFSGNPVCPHFRFLRYSPK